MKNLKELLNNKRNHVIPEYLEGPTPSEDTEYSQRRNSYWNYKITTILLE